MLVHLVFKKGIVFPLSADRQAQSKITWIILGPPAGVKAQSKVFLDFSRQFVILNKQIIGMELVIKKGEHST